MLSRHSSIELAEKVPEAVTPCGSRRQPSTRMQSATFAAIPCMYSVVGSTPVGVGAP